MTTTNQPIVVGVDGSTSAEQAVRWAAREAMRRNAPLRLVHSCLVIEAHAPVSSPRSFSEALAVLPGGCGPAGIRALTGEASRISSYADMWGRGMSIRNISQ